MNDIFHQAMESISRNPADTIDGNAVLLAKSEEDYKKYKNAYVRKILINGLGFEKRLVDTSRRLKTAGTRLYNSLHVNSRPWVIRNNIFVHPGDQVDPYSISDNERYLRTLDFIQDARILIRPVPGRPDSVDLEVITKDLFSIEGDVDASGLDRIKTRLGDKNFLGMGQNLRLTLLNDVARHPGLGYEFLYSKNNIGGSFIHAAIAYSNINTGTSLGNEEEQSSFLRLERPLVSPNSHYAGAFEYSINKSVPYYHATDSDFLDYKYDIFDIWGGYNVDISGARRDRKFVALRYFKTSFERTPIQIGSQFDPIYNTKEGVLASLTLFKQDFFKTNFIYGFGTTEDLPYGYNATATFGYYRQLNLKRPYAGLDLNRYIASGAGEFYQLFARGGGFYHDNELQDAGLLFGASVFSRLQRVGNLKMRQYFRASYTRLANRVIYEPLRIDNELGIRDYGTDSVRGNSRFNLYAEPFLFLNKKLFGFKFAPFVFVNTALMGTGLSLKKADVYSAVGAGLRTRNENLVFGTIELRVFYFPRTEYGVKAWKVSLNSGLFFRYKSQYVSAPDIVRLNTNDFLN